MYLIIQQNEFLRCLIILTIWNTYKDGNAVQIIEFQDGVLVLFQFPDKFLLQRLKLSDFDNTSWKGELVAFEFLKQPNTIEKVKIQKLNDNELIILTVSQESSVLRIAKFNNDKLVNFEIVFTKQIPKSDQNINKFSIALVQNNMILIKEKCKVEENESQSIKLEDNKFNFKNYGFLLHFIKYN